MIGRQFKTRQTPGGQRQASLLTSTAAKNRLWPAPAQMRLPCRAKIDIFHQEHRKKKTFHKKKAKQSNIDTETSKQNTL